MGEGIRLWGRLTSANVQKAVWALEEAGVPYERIDVGGKHGGLDTPEYMALNPNARIPTLQDGELTIWESHAITRYVSARYASGTLWPEEVAQRAIADQWTDWTATTFQPAWIGVFYLAVRTVPSKRDRRSIDAAVRTASKVFGILEDQLGRSPYLAGDRLTYADIVAGVALYRWFSMEIERQAMPNVEAWHRRLLERPAFVAGTCVPYDDLIGNLR